MTRSIPFFALCSLGALTLGCHQSVGEGCSASDMQAAHTIVYDSSGTPAYAGQAIMIGSCAGGGTFCHAAAATRRYGAPSDLNFDPLLADDPTYPDEATGAEQLYQAQLRIHHFRDDIYSTSFDRTMPPGQAGIDTAIPYFDATGAPLPGLDTDQGLEMLRVWLACGVPVVEATSNVAEPSCTTGTDCPAPHLCESGHCVPVGDVVARRTR